MIKIKNRYLIYFIIAGLLLGSFIGSIRANAVIFGSNGTTGSNRSIENLATAGYYQMGANIGTANYVSVYLIPSLLYAQNVKCKIYYGNNGTALVNGETTETFVSGEGIAEWFSFTFDAPKPVLNANTYYYLVVFGTSGAGTCSMFYLTTGTSTTTFISATYGTFPTTWTGYTTVDSSSTPRIFCDYSYIPPTQPTNFIANPKTTTNNTISLSWTKGTYATYTRIQYQTGSYPATISSGTNAYNGTGTSYDLSGLTPNTLYYFRGWSYNSSTALWSIFSATATATTFKNPVNPLYLQVKALSSTSIFVNWSRSSDADYTMVAKNNTNYITNYAGGFVATTLLNYTANSLNCNEYWYYTIWSYNSTSQLYSYTYLKDKDRTNCCDVGGNSTNLTIYNNTQYVTKGYQSTYSSSTGWKVYLNFSSASDYTTAGSSNFTGDVQLRWLNSKTWMTYINLTGISHNLTTIFDVENATYINTIFYNPYTGWLQYINITGNVSIGNCSGIYWFNYSDDNITINVSFNKQTNSFVDDYAINENNWLNIMSALLLDNSQFFIIILLALWLFFISKYLEHKDVTVALMQFGLSIPLTIVISVISMSYAFGYIIVFLIPIISLVLLADGFFYSKRKR